ncbi:MAG: hypothetical protein AAGI30_07185 [Planctomycetota bacterium]
MITSAPSAAAAGVVLFAGSAHASGVVGQFNVTLGYSETVQEVVLDLAGNASTQDLVFRQGPNSDGTQAFWELGTFDRGIDSDGDPMTTLSTGSSSSPGALDDADFAFFDGPSTTGGLDFGSTFDPSGTGGFIPTTLYVDKDTSGVNSDNGLMGGGAADGEVRYLGFAFSLDGTERGSPNGDVPASDKLAGWIAIQINQVVGPDPNITRDDTEITLLDYSYSLTPGEAVTVGVPVPVPGTLAALAFGAVAAGARPRRS